ncbi:MAG: transcriptional regulator [Cyanobacteria bacterium P01_C01_bin.72]
MTLTIDRPAYAKVLAEYQPKIIETEAENDNAIALANGLEHKNDLTSEELAMLELLTLLIEKFEEENYSIPESTPQQTLLHLIESNGLKQENLVGVIGSRGVVSEVVNGKRSISKAQARKLADFFSVDVGLFIA